jgi:hypothetical protein
VGIRWTVSTAFSKIDFTCERVSTIRLRMTEQLTTERPRSINIVNGEHPNSRPQLPHYVKSLILKSISKAYPVTCRHLCLYFNSAISDAGAAASQEPSALHWIDDSSQSGIGDSTACCSICVGIKFLASSKRVGFIIGASSDIVDRVIEDSVLANDVGSEGRNDV